MQMRILIGVAATIQWVNLIWQ